MLGCPSPGTILAAPSPEGSRLSPEPVIRKRVVLLHATGALAGLAQIIGCLEGTAKDLFEALDPAFMYGDPKNLQTAHHAKTTPRYIAYHEWAQAPRGKLNDFYPAQR